MKHVLCVAALVLSLLGIAAPALADDEQVEGLNAFGACLESSGQANVLLVMDESGSLKVADPDDARITAAKFLVEQLSQFAQTSEADMSIRVTGFHNFFNPGTDWQQLPAQAKVVADELDSYKNKNDGEGTDYWLALDGARSLLIDRLKEQPDSCQLMVFVSDGALDIDRSRQEREEGKILVNRPYAPENKLMSESERKAAADAASTSMCREGGLIDQFATQGVTLLGVGLLGEGKTNPHDFDLMKRLVTGTGEAGSCGSQIEGSSGDFVLAKDIDELLPFFHRLSNPNRDPVEQQVRVCQGDVCPEGAHSIVLDDSISKVDILAIAPGKGMVVYLIRPDGKQEKLSLSDSAIGELSEITTETTTGTVEWQSTRSLQILLEREGTDSWRGQWQLIFVDPDSQSEGELSRSQITVTGDLTAAPVGDWEVRAGEEAEIYLRLVSGADEEVDPANILGTIETVVRFKAAPGGELANWASAADFANPIDVDASDLAPGIHPVAVDMTVTTAETTDTAGSKIPGTTLAPQHLEFPLKVLPALGFPTVGQQVIFGTATGEVSLEADLALRGEGCVWLDESGPQKLKASPDGVDTVALSSTANSVDTCVQLAEGEEGGLPLLLTSDQSGTGGLAGTFTVNTAPLQDPSKVQTVEVSYLANMVKPLDTQKFAITLVLALLLGPGIPLLLLYALKFFVVSRIPHGTLVGAAIPVRFDGTSVKRADESPLQYGDDWVLPSNTAGPARDASALGRQVSVAGNTLQVHNGWSPFGTGTVRVTTPDHMGVGDTDLRPAGRAKQAQLPLAVQGHWALLRPPGAGDGDGVLLALFSYRSSTSERADMVADFRRKAPEAFRALSGGGSVGGREGPGQPGPFDSGPSSRGPFGGGPASGGAYNNGPFDGGQQPPTRPSNGSQSGPFG